MIGHIVAGDFVRYALIAHRPNEPIIGSGCGEDRRARVLTAALEIGADTVEIIGRAGEQADRFNELDRIGQITGPEAVSPALDGRFHQTSATKRRCESLSPSMYLCVVWIERWPASS